MTSRWNTGVGWFTWCAAWPAEWMKGKARALRNLLVSEAPDEWADSNGTTLEYAGCWLSGKVIGEGKCLAQSK